MSEKQSYRDADDMPTERAVLEREWKAMRLALSTPRAALAAQLGVVPSNLVRAMLHNAMDRMDRARNLLTDGNPRPDCNWGMLDASDLRKALAAAPTEAKPAPAPGYCKHCEQYTIEEPLPAQTDAVDAERPT